MVETRQWQREHLAELIRHLLSEDYRVLAPKALDGAIEYESIRSLDELPQGWYDEQSPGHYQLHHGDSQRLFAFTVGPQSWKKFLQPPRQQLWSALRTSSQNIALEPSSLPPEKFAFLGVRACELQAIEVQDRVYLEGPYRDERYAQRRDNALIIAVNCSRAVTTCFCTSMGDGPKVRSGYDLALTEVEIDEEHFFAVTPGSADGERLLSAIGSEPISAAQAKAVLHTEEQAEQQVRRNKSLNTEGIQDLLYRQIDSDHWQAVAQRCLSCSNCTMVCPTCFCSTVQDHADVSGDYSERWQLWDSCFNADFSYIHGGSVRNRTASRYRQWLTHKLATWYDQFNSSGCVGCGRCVTWCPVGIDLRDEVAAIRVLDTSKNHVESP